MYVDVRIMKTDEVADYLTEYNIFVVPTSAHT